MKPWRKWARRLFWAFILFVALLLAVQRFVLPSLAKGVVLSRLHAMGFVGASLDFESIGLWRASLNDLKLADGFQADQIRVTYSLFSLMKGRVWDIHILGPILTVVQTPQGHVISGWPTLSKEPSNHSFDWPARSIVLAHGVLKYSDVSGATTSATISGVLTEDDKNIACDLALQLAGREVGLQAMISFESDSIQLRTARVKLHPSPRVLPYESALPLHEFEVALSNATIRNAAEGGWRVDLPDMVATGTTRPWSYRGIQWPESRVRIPLSASVHAGGAEIRLMTSGDLEWAGILTSVADQPLIGSSGLLHIKAIGDEPIVRLRWTAADDWTAQLSLAFTTGKPMKIQWGQDSLAEIGLVDVQLLGDWTAVGPENIRGTLQISDSRVAHSSIKATGIEAALPYAMLGPAYAEMGWIKVGDVTFDDHSLGSIELEANLNHSGVEASGRWNVAQEIYGDIEAFFDGQRARAMLSIPETDLSLLQAHIQPIVELDGVELSGRVGGRAELSLSQSRLQQSLELSLDNVSYVVRETETAVEQVNGTLAFDSLLPPRTAGAQSVSIGSFKQGKISLSRGDVLIEVHDSNRLQIDRMDWRFGAEGRVTAHAIHFDRRIKALETELFIEDMNLEDWLGVLTDEKISATGKLYGRVPFRARSTPDGYKVAFGRGFLYNAPGTGSLKMKDAQSVSDLLAQADPRFTQDPQLVAVRKNLSTALTDFEYSVFRFNLIPQPDDDTTLQMFTQGKGRGPGGQEIGGLTVNFNNFQLATNMALFGQSVFGEGINRRLEEFFEPIER